MGLSVEDEEERMLVNSAFYVVYNKKQQHEETWKLPDSKGEDAKNKVRELIQLPIVNALSGSFKVATNLRNDFNHSGFRNNPMKANKMIKSIGERIQKVCDILIPDNDVH